MSPYQAIAISAGIFLTIVSVQVALARRGQWVAAWVFAGAALLAMTGVAYASIRTSFGVDAPSDPLVREILRVSASLYGIVLLGTTSMALWAARRLRLPAHWVATAAAGLLTYLVAIQIKPVFTLDIVTASQDGPEPGAVVDPTR